MPSKESEDFRINPTTREEIQNIAKRGIPTKPSELRDQLLQAATGIGGEAN